jgi:copper homeostasis protein
MGVRRLPIRQPYLCEEVGRSKAGIMGLEICVDSVQSAVAAQAGGAQRVELCSALFEGGLTPSLGLIRAVCSRVDIGVHVMIRPRGGDFLYSEEELAVMRADIEEAARCGADGVVFGVLTAEGDVDVERTRMLVELARPMNVTFHRAIDLTRDVEQSIEDVICTGASWVLTAGGEQTAMQGRAGLRRLVQRANGRIRVMAGGGVRSANVQEIMRATGVTELHAALRTSMPSPMEFQPQKVRLGDPAVDGYARRGVRSGDVKMLRQRMDEAVTGNLNGYSS